MDSTDNSSTTQPYVEEEWEEEQVMDSGSSSSVKKPNAADLLDLPMENLSAVACQTPSPAQAGCSTSRKESNGLNPVLQSSGDFPPVVFRTPPDAPGFSASGKMSNVASTVKLTGRNSSPLACVTPSPVPPHRANFKPNAELEAPSQARTSPGTYSGTSPAVISSRPVPKSWEGLQSEQAYGDPRSIEHDSVHRKTGSSEDGTIPRMGSSPSLSTRAGATTSSTPVGEEWECQTGSTTVGVRRVREEAQHARKRPVGRALFSPSDPQTAAKIAPYDDVPNVLESNSQLMQHKSLGVHAEGTSNALSCPANAHSREMTRVREGHYTRPHGQPGSNGKVIIKEEGTDELCRRIFGDRQPVQWPDRTEHLLALGSLNFATAFQVLERLKGKSLETTNVEDIKKLKDVPQANVQSYLCQLPVLQMELSRGNKPYSENSRFECCVTRLGTVQYQISEQREGLTALQRCFGPDRVLRVFFADGLEPTSAQRKIMQEGLIVGLRHYQYWTHKDTGKDEKKKTVGGKFWSTTHCYFVCTRSEAASDTSNPAFRQFRTIREARSFMMHIHTTPNEHKYSARLQLALSQTQPVDLDFSTITVRVDKDIVRTDDRGRVTTCTDGTGFISVDLAEEIGASLREGKTNPEKLFGDQDYPTIIQVRLFHKGTANKGTLLTHLKIPKRTIVLRESMQKVKADPKLSDFPSFNSLEICGFSTHSREAKLSRDLIMLLTLGDVPESFFMKLLDDEIKKVRTLLRDRKAAYDAIQDCNYEKAELARRMILAGIPPTETYLQKTIMDLRKDLLQDFRTGRVSLPSSCYYYGAADPTGTLKPNQVAIATETGLVCWPKVAVYKHPGKHPGDIRIFEAVGSNELHKLVGSPRFVIFFSTQGSRSVPDEISKSDLDGDKYLIIWNTKLLAEFAECETRWYPQEENSNEQAMCKLADLSFGELEDKLIQKFFEARFNTSGDIGTVSNWWLAHMDLFVSLRNSDNEQAKHHYSQAKDLIDPFYALVDSEKTGIKVRKPRELEPDKRPHFQEKTNSTYIRDPNVGFGVFTNEGEYKSTTILGKIYDKGVRAAEEFKANVKLDYEPAFRREGSPPTGLFAKWRNSFIEYNKEMKRHVKEVDNLDDSLEEARNTAIFRNYRKILYGADSEGETKRDFDTLSVEASIIYAVVFQKANLATDRDPSFHFAWMVAGPTLCRMYKEYHKQDGRDNYTLGALGYDAICRKPRNRAIEGIQEDRDCD